jgi:hypothetical protein
MVRPPGVTKKRTDASENLAELSVPILASCLSIPWQHPISRQKSDRAAPKESVQPKPPATRLMQDFFWQNLQQLFAAELLFVLDFFRRIGCHEGSNNKTTASAGRNSGRDARAWAAAYGA